MASRQPLPLSERSGRGAPAADQLLADLSEYSSACSIKVKPFFFFLVSFSQGSSLRFTPSTNRGFFFFLSRVSDTAATGSSNLKAPADSKPPVTHICSY